MRPEEISEYVQGIREAIKDYEKRITALEEKVAYLTRFTEPIITYAEDDKDLYAIAEKYGFDDPMDMFDADNM